MTKEELQNVRKWADEKIATGDMPPWAWYQHMKLREALDAILAGLATVTPAGSQQSEQHQGSALRLVASNSPQDIAQHHRVEPPVQLPM